MVVLLVDWFYPVRKPASNIVRKTYTNALTHIQAAFQGFHQEKSLEEINDHLDRANKLMKSAQDLLPAAAQEPSLWKSPWRADVAEDLFDEISSLRISMIVLVAIKHNPQSVSINENAINIREQICWDLEATIKVFFYISK